MSNVRGCVSEITKHIGIAINDADAGRITYQHLLKIFQEAIDNGDILLEENELYVVGTVLPLLDRDVLKRSPYVDDFEARMNATLQGWIRNRQDATAGMGSNSDVTVSSEPTEVAPLESEPDVAHQVVKRKRTLLLNVLIVAAHIAIAALTGSPWVMFSGFLLLAVGIRCATLCWLRFTRAESERPSLVFILANLVLGILFASVLLWFLWWLGRFWLPGIKILAPAIAVFVAYKSTFPLGPSRQDTQT